MMDRQDPVPSNTNNTGGVRKTAGSGRVVGAWKVQKDNTLAVYSLSEPAAKRAAHGICG